MDTRTLEAAQRYQIRLAKRKAKRANRGKSVQAKQALARRREADAIRDVK